MSNLTVDDIKIFLNGIKGMKYILDITSSTFDVSYKNYDFTISKGDNCWVIGRNRFNIIKKVVFDMDKLFETIKSIIDEVDNLDKANESKIFNMARDYGFKLIPINNNKKVTILRLEGFTDYNDIILYTPYPFAWIIECRFMELATKPIKDSLIISGILSVIKKNILSNPLPTGISNMHEITNNKYVSIPIRKIELELDAYEYDYKTEFVDDSVVINATYSNDVKLVIIRNELNEWSLADHTSNSVKMYNLDSMDDVRELLSEIKSCSDWNKPKVVKEEPFSSLPDWSDKKMDLKQPVKLDLDFINDYKLMKSIERSINDNLDVIASAFYKYTKVDAPAEFINDDNAKVFFFVEREDSIELNFEFALGEDVYSYTFTRRGIRLLDDYDKQAVMVLANLIERTVKIWLNKFSSKDNFSELSDNLLFATENIKIMIGLMVRTINIYSE
jgi:hypothetical protein|nr:MAG TPA: hypothetical protein [Caudoviricetes sp.]